MPVFSSADIFPIEAEVTFTQDARPFVDLYLLTPKMKWGVYDNFPCVRPRMEVLGTCARLYDPREPRTQGSYFVILPLEGELIHHQLVTMLALEAYMQYLNSNTYDPENDRLSVRFVHGQRNQLISEVIL